VHSKADTSQLNLSTARNQQLESGKTEKVKSKKRVCSEVPVNSPGESVKSVLKKKRKATMGRICRKGRFKAAVSGDGCCYWFAVTERGRRRCRRCTRRSLLCRHRHNTHSVRLHTSHSAQQPVQTSSAFRAHLRAVSLFSKPAGVTQFALIFTAGPSAFNAAAVEELVSRLRCSTFFHF